MPPEPPTAANPDAIALQLPRPTVSYRLRAWRRFQRLVDPLAPPRPLPRKRR